MSILRCSHCGTANREGSNFCNRCGTALHEQAEQQPEDLPSTAQALPTDLEESHAELGEEWSRATDPQGQSEPDLDREQATRAVPTQPDLPGGPTADAAGVRQRFIPPPSGHSPAGDGRSLSRTAPDDEWPEEHVSDDDFLEPEQTMPTRQLVTGVQGLLDPIRLTGTIDLDALANTGLRGSPHLTIPADQLRRIRTLVTEDPVLIEHLRPRALLPPTRFRLPWLIMLLLAAVGLPILLGIEGPTGEARLWSGVTEAHAAINALPADATVHILWAYDPATAGELDLVMRPVAMHLIEQGIQVQIISLLPTGLATARRLWDNTTADLIAANRLPERPDRIDYWEGGFLPGGAPALALVAQAPIAALVGHTPQATRPFSLESSALSIVVAAQAEDVQQWLELVQPTTLTPVVAVTAAGAGPLLRPYLASGQLIGLVSGFDGAANYHTLRNQRATPEETARLRQQLAAQNWGHIALIAILVLGNLSALWLGQNGAEQRSGGNRG